MNVHKLTQDIEKSMPEIDNPAYDIDIFWLLELAVTRNLVEKTSVEKEYCDCCKTIHFHQWFNNKRTEDSFYICTAQKTAMIKYKSGNRAQIGIPDLVNQIF